MKIQLQFEQTDSQYGYKETRLVRIKLMDDNGKYIKFMKHDKEIIDLIQKTIIDIPNNLKK